MKDDAKEPQSTSGSASGDAKEATETIVEYPIEEVPLEKPKTKRGVYVDLINAERTEGLRLALSAFKAKEPASGALQREVDEVEFLNKRVKEKLAAKFKPITEADILDVKPKGQGVVQDKVGIVTNDGQKYYL